MDTEDRDDYAERLRALELLADRLEIERRFNALTARYLAAGAFVLSAAYMASFWHQGRGVDLLCSAIWAGPVLYRVWTEARLRRR